jgi:hypothetical protein
MGVDQVLRLFVAVATDGFHGAAGQGFFAEGALVVGLRLLIEEGMTAVVITLEVSRCGLAAEIAVDALIIDVVGTGSVMRVLVGGVGHWRKVGYRLVELGLKRGAMLAVGVGLSTRNSLASTSLPSLRISSDAAGIVHIAVRARALGREPLMPAFTALR